MALFFSSNNPTGLLADFKKKIDQKHIVTWMYDKDGDFTHATDQWRNKAWLRPTVIGEKLVLYILSPRTEVISREVYAIYHGRFVESMLAHCDNMFSNASATALASGKDAIAA